MALVIKGSSSGQVTIDVPAAAGTNTLTIPASTGTMALTTDVTGATSVGTLTSLTVSGDATFDTSTLKVDSTNNRVGIGTASPSGSLHINTADANIIISDTDDGNGSQGRIRSDASGNLILEADIGNATGSSGMRFLIDNSEEMRLENDGDLHVDGDVIAFSTTISDVALKSDIEMIPNALDKIDEVRGVTFTRHNGQKSAGIIAQELEKVLPEAVREKTLDLLDGKKYKTVEYDAIHGLLINCIKELKEEIKELKNGFTK